MQIAPQSIALLLALATSAVTNVAAGEEIQLAGQRTRFDWQTVSVSAAHDPVTQTPVASILVDGYCAPDIRCFTGYDVRPGSPVPIQGKGYIVKSIRVDDESRATQPAHGTPSSVGSHPVDSAILTHISPSPLETVEKIPLLANGQAIGFSKADRSAVMIFFVSLDLAGEPEADVEWQLGRLPDWNEQRFRKASPKLSTTHVKVKSGSMLDIPIVGRVKVQLLKEGWLSLSPVKPL